MLSTELGQFVGGAGSSFWAKKLYLVFPVDSGLQPGILKDYFICRELVMKRICAVMS